MDLAFYYAVLGRTADVVRNAERALELIPPIKRDHWSHSLQLINVAEVYAMAQLEGQAIDLLSALLDMPSGISVDLLRIDPVWAPLRSNPEFQALLKDVSN